MAKKITASVFIDGVKRRAAIPENQATFEAEDFLAFADEELLLGIVPGIMTLHEDYFLYEIEVPIVNGQDEYEIPSRSAGNKLRDVQYKPNDKTFIEMTRIGIGDRFTNTEGQFNDLRHFYIKNNKVVVNTSIKESGSGVLLFIFYIKPSQLVLEEKVGIIQGINDLNNGKTEIVLNSLPSEFNTSIIYDVYKSESPSSILKIDMVPLSINVVTRSVTFSSTDIPNDLKIGDHLAQAGEATIPQIPNEFHAMLEQMVACRILEAQGDTSNLQNALLKLKQMEIAGNSLIDNRVDDAPQKIRNRHSLLRAGFRRRYYR